MTGLSLRQAAEETGTSKSTIQRAIKAGRLSATRTDDGGYSIDPAELFRVYDRKIETVAAERPAPPSVGQDATEHGTDLVIRNAQLEAQLDAARQMLESERLRAEELREDRDRWAEQAKRLALAPPPTVTTSPVAEPQGGGGGMMSGGGGMLGRLRVLFAPPPPKNGPYE